MGTTSRGYPYPDLSDSPAGPTQLQALAQAVDTDMGSQNIGTDWTPTLTGTASNPVLGTGSSVVGKYVRLNELVTDWGQIKVGASGFSGGSGSTLIGWPSGVTPAVGIGTSGVDGAMVIGFGKVVIGGVWYEVQFELFPGTTDCHIRYISSGPHDVTDSTPAAWQAGDSFRFKRQYLAV